MASEPHLERQDDRLGERALAVGVAACVTALVPVIGEYIAAPAAALGITLGLVGIHRYEAGLAARIVPAVAGVILSACAALMVIVVLVVTHVGP